MNHVDKLFDQLRSLKPEENQYLFLRLLKQSKVSFKNLSEAYVQYLEEEKNEVYNKLADSTANLSMYVTDRHSTTEEKTIHRYTAMKSLINVGLYKGTQFEIKMKQEMADIRKKYPHHPVIKG